MHNQLDNSHGGRVLALATLNHLLLLLAGVLRSITSSLSLSLVLLQLLLSLVENTHTLDNGIIQILAQFRVAQGIKQFHQNHINSLGNRPISLRHLLGMRSSGQNNMSGANRQNVTHKEELVQDDSLAL